MNWYYAINSQQLGPVPEQELARLVATGTIHSGTLIWRDGMGDWQPLGTACPSAMGMPGAETPQLGGYALPEAGKDLIVQQMREGVLHSAPGGYPYAGFWIRFVAKFIDGLILFVPQMMLQMAVTMAVGARGSFSTSGHSGNVDLAPVLAMLISMVLSILIQATYNILLVSNYGATWGKMAVGLRIVNEDGSKLTTGKAVGRFFAEMVSGLTLYIGYIIAGFDDEKRALHDHICATRVIATR